MIYISHFKPHKQRSANLAELINEGLLLLSSYILFYYTDYNNITGFEDYKYNAGWVAMGLIMLVIVWNVVRILRKDFSPFKNKVMSRCKRKGKTKKHQLIYKQQSKLEKVSI